MSQLIFYVFVTTTCDIDVMWVYISQVGSFFWLLRLEAEGSRQTRDPFDDRLVVVDHTLHSLISVMGLIYLKCHDVWSVQNDFQTLRFCELGWRAINLY